MTRRWKRRIEVYVDETLYKRVEEIAAQHNLSNSSWVKVLIIQELERMQPQRTA